MEIFVVINRILGQKVECAFSDEEAAKKYVYKQYYPNDYTVTRTTLQ